MNRKKMLLLLMALVIAGGSVQLVRSMNEQNSQRSSANDALRSQSPEKPPLRILVAAADLPAGTLIRENHLRWQDWPRGGAAKDAYMAQGQRTLEEFAGAVVRRGLAAGEPVTGGRLVLPGERGFLAVVLEPEMRAVSVPVNAVTGIAGFVFPGDRVDLILTHAVERNDDPNRQNRRASETVLTNVRVLAIDQTTDDQSDKPRIGQIATLEVMPKQVEIVALAKELGRLSLSLRSLSESEREPTVTAVSVEGFENLRKRRTVSSPSERRDGRGYTWDSDVSLVLPGPSSRESLVHRVQVMRGSDTSTVSFDTRR